MVLPPLIERELRCALRKKDARKTRMRGALAAGGITAFFLLIAGLFGLPGFGRQLHLFLFWIGLYIAVVQTPVLTADLFCLERRNQTLGLLFLAGLRPGEVFASKVLGGAMVSFSNLLALVPFLAVPFLSGGLSFSLFLATVCCLPNLLLFTLSLTILASVLCEDEGTTMVLAAVAGLVISGLTPVFYEASKSFSVGTPLSAHWLLASPAYGPYLIYRGLAVGSAAEFWRNAAFTLAWSCLALTLAGLVLQRIWRDRPLMAFGSGWRARWRSWFHGTPRWRRETGRRWLDPHPFTWLAMYDRAPERLAWCLVTAGAMIWLAGFCAWPKTWPSVANFLITATVLNVIVEWIALYAAGKRVAEDRRSGAFELLLTSPLSESQIIEGQIEALRAQFQPIFWATFMLNLAMMLCGFLGRNWNLPALFVYVMIWTPLLLWSWRRSFRSSMLPIWISLNCGRPAYAAWRATGQWGGFSWLWILFNLGNLHSGLRNFPSGTAGEFVLVFVLAAVVIGVAVYRRQVNPIERRLFAEFRSVAQTPLPEPSDPRFKKWNILERFPSEENTPIVILGPRWRKCIQRAGRQYGRWTRR